MKRINQIINEIFPKGVGIIFLHAHPDDESFLNAGLISHLNDRGRDCHVVFCASRVLESQPKTLVRRDEAFRSCNKLGCDKLYFLEFDDKKGEKAIIDCNIEDIFNDCENKLCHVLQNPFILISYDENGGYGNPDHLKVNELGIRIKDSYQTCLRLYESTINRDMMKNWIDYARNNLDANHLPELGYWSDDFGIPERQINFFFELNNSYLDRKKLSMLAHRTQIYDAEFPLNLDRADFSKIFGKEYLKLHS